MTVGFPVFLTLQLYIVGKQYKSDYVKQGKVHRSDSSHLQSHSKVPQKPYLYFHCNVSTEMGGLPVGLEILITSSQFYYVPYRNIVFGADPVGVSFGVGVSVTLSCLHDIS